ncbi:hypothetical protein Taro_056429 [Colocasia esculenta]|uniref:Aminotransferase-like plant mobile domain-containing protein n=1 Tax=Colocasia esculenta TaxID=4460 RepID=A0A843XXA8_COLES|nr:hypothetical protein [Colocasia esculenta]
MKRVITSRMRADSALTQALRSRWDAEATAFVFLWGHMIPSLEDVSRITGLRVYGRPVSGYTYPCYHNLAQRLLELPVERRSSLVPRVPLQESLGLFDVGKGAGESEDEHLDRLVRVSRRELASDPRAQANLDLRRFLVLFLGRLLFATRGDAVHCRFLPLLEDLSEVGGYAWGAAFLAHQFDRLGTSERQTSTSGFFPFLQVVWQPYLGQGDEGQPWLVQARPYFGRRELERVRSTGAGGASSSRAAGGSPSLLEAQLAGAVLRADEAQRHLEERVRERFAAYHRACHGSLGPEGPAPGEVQTTRSERDQLHIRVEAAEAQVAEATKELEALRVQRSLADREELERVRAELRAQEAVSRSLQQIVTDIGRSRSRSRSGASANRATGASVGQYLAGSSSRRRNEEGERRRQGEASTQSARGGEMLPPPDRQEGSGESGGGH